MLATTAYHARFFSSLQTLFNYKREEVFLRSTCGNFTTMLNLARCSTARFSLVKRLFCCASKRIFIEFFESLLLVLSELPAQLAFGQDQRHQQEVGAHAESAEAEDESGLGCTTWMTLEHLGRVRRPVSRRADAES